MDEIGVQAVGPGSDPVENRVGALRLERVPAHVRDLEPRIGGPDRRDVAGNPAEALGGLVFEAAGREQLRPDADAEERLALLPHRLRQRLDHAGDGVEAAPAVGEGADARQHDVSGGEHVLGVRRDLHRAVEPSLARGALEGLVRRVQISRAVVDDGDGHG